VKAREEPRGSLGEEGARDREHEELTCCPALFEGPETIFSLSYGDRQAGQRPSRLSFFAISMIWCQHQRHICSTNNRPPGHRWAIAGHPARVKQGMGVLSQAKTLAET